jgi:hypothetical protein
MVSAGSAATGAFKQLPDQRCGLQIIAQLDQMRGGDGTGKIITPLAAFHAQVQDTLIQIL